jgi:hypothetical protein
VEIQSKIPEITEIPENTSTVAAKWKLPSGKLDFRRRVTAATVSLLP